MRKDRKLERPEILKSVALFAGDVVKFPDGGLTTIVDTSLRNLVQHTGGFFDRRDTVVELVTPVRNRSCDDTKQEKPRE